MGNNIPTGSGAEPSKKPEIIDARCIVEFRPDNNWQGEYGFDWFRIGDHKEKLATYKDESNTEQYYRKDLTTNGANDGATHYVNDNIVGRYYEVDSKGLLKIPPNDRIDPDDPNLECSLYTDVVDKKYYWADLLAKYYTIKTIKGLSRNYIVPWISLFYDKESKRSATFANFGAEAKTSVIIKMRIKKDSTNIKRIRKIRVVSLEDRVRFGKGNKQWKKNNKVIFNYIEFEGPFSSDPEQEITLPVNLRYSISKDWPIKAYAYYYGHDDNYCTLSGQINVVKCVPKTANILLVNVNFWAVTSNDALGHKYGNQIINNTNFSVSEQEEFLNKYLSQAFVIPNVEKESLPLYVDTRSIVSYEPNNPNNDIFLYNSNNNHDIRDISKYVALKRDRGYIILFYGKDNSKLNEKLESIINSVFNDKYKNYYKIFFIDLKGVQLPMDIKKMDKKGSLGGITTLNGKSAIVFGNPSDETACHELLHCFGLKHSFSNKSQFTYKISMTSNIMDYRFVGNKYNCLKRISLSRWQWNQIREKFEKEERIKQLNSYGKQR